MIDEIAGKDKNTVYTISSFREYRYGAMLLTGLRKTLHPKNLLPGVLQSRVLQCRILMSRVLLTSVFLLVTVLAVVSVGRANAQTTDTETSGLDTGGTESGSSDTGSSETGNTESNTMESGDTGADAAENANQESGAEAPVGVADTSNMTVEQLEAYIEEQRKELEAAMAERDKHAEQLEEVLEAAKSNEASAESQAEQLKAMCEKHGETFQAKLDEDPSFASNPEYMKYNDACSDV